MRTGWIVSGVKVRRTERDLVLRDAVRGDVAIPLASIEARKGTGSIMPSGLPDLPTRAEFGDLLGFLSALGRPGPHAVPDIPVVRRWRVARDLAERPVFPPSDWAPATSDVSGSLPRSDFGTGLFAVLEFEVEATTPGLAKITLDPTEGVTPGESPGSPARFRVVHGN